jgi:alkylhydroperoxidase family enzyme
MARIQGVDKAQVEPRIAQAFAQQTARWGAPLEPYEIYARRPSIFRAVQGMWGGLGASGLLDGKLTALVNRRVAALNGCVF